jgi:glycerol-3-phosphate dehydrogenase (NAD(P)+)
MNRNTKTIGVIGAGAWGTALAQAFATPERPVLIWARETEVVESINGASENTLFLPGVSLDPMIAATSDLAALRECAVLLLVTPAQYVRPTLHALKPHLRPGVPVVNCAKGIEIGTGKLMTDIAAEILPDTPAAILTGPTFAAEIARGLPSAVTVAINDAGAAQVIRDTLIGRTLRPYLSDDVVGTQVGGAVKNVIAIACGIVYGLKLGESAKAALMTRGLAEMARLAESMGGRRETLLGLCGVGDLVLTCSSMQSRNFSLGVALAEGRTLEQIMAERNSVAEGVHTAKALMDMAGARNIDMPISAAVHRCVSGDRDVGRIVAELLERPLKPENA